MPHLRQQLRTKPTRQKKTILLPQMHSLRTTKNPKTQTSKATRKHQQPRPPINLRRMDQPSLLQTKQPRNKLLLPRQRRQLQHRNRSIQSMQSMHSNPTMPRLRPKKRNQIRSLGRHLRTTTTSPQKANETRRSYYPLT